jgi:very-short-patch-repair endonuclease
MPQQKREHSEEAHQHWHKKWNKQFLPDTQLSDLGYHDKQKVYWHALCRKRGHCRFLAVDTVNEHRRDALKCKPCGETKTKASKYERRLYSLLSKNHWHFAVEVYLEMTATARLPLANHAFDVMLIATGLLIEVDGEQHFGSDMMQVMVEEQQESDEKVNKAVASAGLCMVRLHYLDKRADWWDVIKKARTRIEQGDSGFVLYSKSYIKS